ncbi:unnamed protein product [Alopecurus aequalis]
MPGLRNNGCGFSYPRCADKTCGEQSRAQSSPDEELTPDECLALYCEPIELYNIIRLRAIKSPPSLQRCLSYKIDARRRKRLRTGNVLFNYKHCQKLLRTEVTEDFSCSFCLVKCGSFKGLEYHLTSSHDLFHFEFWVSQDDQAVNVSLKSGTRKAELLTTAGDERSKRVFFYRSRFKKRCRRLESTIKKTNHIHPHIMEPGSPVKTVPVDKDVESRSPGNMGHIHAHTTESASSKDAHKGSEEDYVPNENGILVPQASIDSHPTLHSSNHSTSAVLQFGKTRVVQFGKKRKLSVDRADPQNRVLLEKREFYHSQKAHVITIMQHPAIFCVCDRACVCMLVAN